MESDLWPVNFRIRAWIWNCPRTSITKLLRNNFSIRRSCQSRCMTIIHGLANSNALPLKMITEHLPSRVPGVLSAQLLCQYRRVATCVFVSIAVWHSYSTASSSSSIFQELYMQQARTHAPRGTNVGHSVWRQCIFEQDPRPPRLSDVSVCN